MNNEFTKEIYDKIYMHISPRLITGTDRINRQIYEKYYDENYQVIKRKIEGLSYQFTRFMVVDKNNREVYIPTIRDRIVLEYLKWNIKRKYKLNIKGREKIIYEIKTLLDEPMNYYIIRTDIKGFFENINHNILLKKLKKNSLCTVQELYLISELISKCGNRGIPQGISVCNYLAEVYLELFDVFMKRLTPRSAYYARYVDDIIIIIPGMMTRSEVSNLFIDINEIFKKLDLQINSSKTQKIYFDKEDSESFNYLGYDFKRKNRVLCMSLTSKKKGKMLEKINWMFKEYASNNNYELLYERLKVFTSVNKFYKTRYVIDKNNDIRHFKEAIYWGINYDYRYIQNESIDEINQYIKRKIVNSGRISVNQKKKLYAILINRQDKKWRLISYEKIPLMKIKSLVYRLYGGTYTWNEVLRMSRYTLIYKYLAITKCDY